jgi:hypothetical protein
MVVIELARSIRTLLREQMISAMKFEYNLSVGEVVVSFLLMMAVVIVGLFTHQYWLAVLGFPLFLRGLLGWCPLKTFLKSRRTEKV